MTLEEKLKENIREIPDFPEPGVLFKDITPIFSDYALCAEVADALSADYNPGEVDVVAAIESRGFLFGMLMAQRLNCAFALIRKKGKLPYQTIEKSYNLEYGSASIEMHEDAVAKGHRVLIHDDLLATGGTAGAAAELVDELGGDLVGFNFLIELEGLKGRGHLQPYNDTIVSLVKF